ncbi:MAG: SIS domain-containing protein [Bacilli bacterium]|nr:SIS domain-containing protein [Bacilli bacterium]
MEKVDFKNAIKEYYEREIRVINNLDLDEINEAMNAIYETYKNQGTIYICGNGGSASTASHFQNDFNKGISEYIDNKFRFYCLNDNVATLMAIANDIGYEEVFRFQITNKITDKDLFIGISGSGNSKNVLNAAEYAKEKGAKVVGITGYTGGKLKELADYRMHVDECDMQIDEDLHMTFDHMMMKIFYNLLVCDKLTGENINDKH